MDIRLQQLSYSSDLTLDRCPREYELYKLAAPASLDDEDGTGALTFDFGKIVGAAIQDALCGLEQDAVIWNVFLNWKGDLLVTDSKRKKSIWLAIFAIQKFFAMRNAGFLAEYELVMYEGKPAVELGFMIITPDGFQHRGSADIVFRHKTTEKILVVDCKTSSVQVSAADYMNSAQALGYSIVLDVIYPDLVSYSVMYLVYKTKEMEWEPYEFPKSYTERAEWIRSMLFRIEDITRYEREKLFPKHGQNCRRFFKDCNYLQICGMKNEHIVTPLTEAIVQKLQEDNKKYTIIVTLEQLIDAQIRKSIK